MIDKFLKSSASIYILWVLLHYTSPHLYVYFCVPLNPVGFAMSIFIAPAPHCQVLRWTIYNGGNMIIAMWVCMGTWLAQLLIPTNRANEKNI